MSIDLDFGKPLAFVKITSGWWRERKYRKGRHEGVDIAARTGEPVYAVQSGTVLRVHDSVTSAAGRYVEIVHDRGWVSRYLHLDSVAVANGQSVARGQFIGRAGRTGVKSSGPHLHFEIRLEPTRLNDYERIFGRPTTGFGRAFSVGVGVPVEPLIPADIYVTTVVKDARKHGIKLRSIDSARVVTPTWVKWLSVGLLTAGVGATGYTVLRKTRHPG